MRNVIGNFFRFIILALTLVALILQFMTSSSCKLVELSSTSAKTMGIFYESDYSGSCLNSSYETDDPFIKSARSMLIVSILSGGIAGFMVLVEWVLFEFFCAGLLESLAFFLAWTSAALTFIFYGAKACQGEDYEDINELFSNVFTEGDVDFSGSGCEYSDSSTYMTTAAVCYFLCAFLLCCTPQPDPIWKQGGKQ